MTPLQRAANQVPVSLDVMANGPVFCDNYVKERAAKILTAALDRDEIAGWLVDAGIHFGDDPLSCYCQEEPEDWPEKLAECLHGRQGAASLLIRKILGGAE